VRESLFMTLEPLHGLRVVDLYAGSGALGIEALSRGAVHVDFVESDPRALAVLRRNLEDLGLVASARVWRLELPKGTRRLGAALAAADLVLIDPPYGKDAIHAMLRELDSLGGLRPGCRIAAEHATRDTVPERLGRLAQERRRRYGQTAVTTYRVEGEPSAQAVHPDESQERS
jgi:16S rRNA (guanine(966)-N(2))-methyltransferase RsmD